MLRRCSPGWWRIVGWLGAGLLGGLGCTQTVVPPADFSIETTDWEFRGAPGKEFRTANFRIFSTLKDPLLQEVLPAFAEKSCRRYEALMPGATRNGKPLTSYVFEQRLQWNRFTREFANPRRVPVYLRIQSGGFTENGVAVLYLIGREKTLSVFAHEGFHQFVSERFDHQIPPWLNEGLACYCEAFEMDGLEPTFTPTRNTFRLNHLRRALTTKKLVPLEELLSTHAGNIIRLGGEKVSTYYAQAWALIVYLLHGDNETYTTGFRRLLTDAGTSRLARVTEAFQAGGGAADTSPGVACFRRYVCDDLEAFNKQFMGYLVKMSGFEPTSENLATAE